MTPDRWPAWRPISTAPRDGDTLILWNGVQRGEGWFDRYLGKWVWMIEATIDPPPVKWLPLPPAPDAADGA
jgi:hypothetical protein